MVDEDELAWRRQRLAELADKLGDRAVLGRLMGYKDGAYLWQMMTGLRPVTEKTITKAESVRHPSLGPHGARGWFARTDDARASAHETPLHYRQLLIDLDALGPTQRSEFMQKIHQAAEYIREAKTPEASPVAVAALQGSRRRSVASLTYGDGNRRQRALPLTTVDDPFSAAPGERESALYRRIERAAKEPAGKAATGAPRKRR